MCKKTIFKDYGSSPRVIKWMYEQLIRPVLTYASSIWIPRLSKKICQRKLDKIQRVACLYGTGAHRSTMTQTMEVIMDIQPIDLFIKEKRIKTYLRMKKYNLWHKDQISQESENRNLNEHKEYIEKLARNAGVVSNIPSNEGNIQLVENMYSMNIDMTKGKTYHEVTPQDIETVNVFTDGSKLQNNNTGSGFIVKSREKDWRCQKSTYLGKMPTVYQAEVNAIYEASEALISKQISGKTINFYTDSKSTMEKLSITRLSGSQEIQTKESLNKLSIYNDVKLHWIKAHEGLLGNEIADRLAKLGAENINGENVIEPKIALNGEDFNREKIKMFITKEHDKKWQDIRASGKGRITQLFFPKPKARKNEKLYEWKKKDLRLITKTISGHIGLRKQLWNIKKLLTPTCKCGEEEESSDHFIQRCPIFCKERFFILGKITLEDGDLDGLWLKDILKFIKETRRLAKTE